MFIQNPSSPNSKNYISLNNSQVKFSGIYKIIEYQDEQESPSHETNCNLLKKACAKYEKQINRWRTNGDYVEIDPKLLNPDTHEHPYILFFINDQLGKDYSDKFERLQRHLNPLKSLQTNVETGFRVNESENQIPHFQEVVAELIVKPFLAVLSLQKRFGRRDRITLENMGNTELPKELQVEFTPAA